jgi:hypothetical protein
MTFPFYGLLPFFSGAIEKGNSPGWFRPCCCCCFAAPRFLLFRIKNWSWKFDVIFDGFLVSIFARLGWWSWVIGRRDWRRDRRRLFCRLRFSVGNGSQMQSRKMEWNLSPENRKATHTQTDRQTDNMRWINLIEKKEKKKNLLVIVSIENWRVWRRINGIVETRRRRYSAFVWIGIPFDFVIILHRI